MKTYPYTENGEIIDLVRKDEHDAVVQELNERLTKQQADMLDTIVERQLEITRWQSLAERLATAIQERDYWAHTMHPAEVQTEEALKEALAAYESAAKGEQP